MTNENEQGVHGESIHEKLCAYVLGELEGGDRMEIERELLRSPELRAQRDTIERTIGLVKETMGNGETLSDEAAESVFSAAKPSKPTAWKSSGFLRLAAGIGAVALGFAIVRESSGSRDADVAKLEADKGDRFGGRVPEIEGRVPMSPPLADYVTRSELDKDAAQFASTHEGVTKNTNSGKSAKREDAIDVPATQLTERSAPIGVGSVVVDSKSDESKQFASADELVGRQRDLDEAVKVAAWGAGTPDSIALGRSSLRLEIEDMKKVATETGAAQPPTVPSTRKFKGGRAGGPTSPGPSGPSTGGPYGPGGSAPARERGESFDEYVARGGGGTKADSNAPAPTAKLADVGLIASTNGFSGSAGSAGESKSKSANGTDHLVSGSKPGEADPSAGRTYLGPGDSVAPGGGGTGAMPAEKKRESGATDPASAGPLLPGSAEAKDGAELALHEEEVVPFDAKRWQSVSQRGGSVARDDESQAVPYCKLAPAEQTIYLERECRRILDDCRPRPNERPRDMYFRFWGDNPFEVTALDAQSTFAADVDTASYTLARRYINEGNVPTKAQIRTEEFVNYFKSDVLAPTSGVFAIHTDLAASRYSTDATRQMLRVVVRGKDLSKVERPRMNLTFVVDVSGSMREQQRLEMVKTAMRLLVTQLTPYDKIGIVKFSTDASVVLPLTNVSEREKIELAIAPLQPEGSTNSNAGLELGYGMALGGIDSEATNRVVFLSDGVANVGETDPAKIAERVKPMREKGIYLNTIGVGMNNHNDVLLEQLADKADGMCAYIDTADEAKKQLVDNFSGAFQPIARDVKIQVEFDASQVLRYRLLGYENRAIADADFRNDKVDAGELGAGHQVTALYEIERQSVASADKPLATVHVRWKEPRNFGLNAESDKAGEITQVVKSGAVSTFEGAGQSYRKAVMAAQFAEILRRSVHARGDSLDLLLNDAVKLSQEIPVDTEFMEFVTLVSKSKDLILRTMPACDELCQAIDEVRESQFRRAQIESMQRELDQKTLADLKQQNDVLETKLRELVRRRLETQTR